MLCVNGPAEANQKTCRRSPKTNWDSKEENEALVQSRFIKLVAFLGRSDEGGDSGGGCSANNAEEAARRACDVGHASCPSDITRKKVPNHGVDALTYITKATVQPWS